jgi:hypothetical protein
MQAKTVRLPASFVHDTLQVAVFDLELQAPAASTKLPGGRPAFRAVLGAFGHASAGGALLSTGLDLLYCLHQVCGTPQQQAELSAGHCQ